MIARLKMYDYQNLAHLYPVLALSADLKTQKEDFIVDEIMPVTLSGEGEHCWLNITKKGSNTDFVATELARFCGLKSGAVSYAGLKDRNAITTQWFSVHMPGMKEPEWQDLKHDEFVINEVRRHSRKLKRGALAGNQFKIRLRNLKGDAADWDQRLSQILENGVPNYFGLQRFGHQMNNLNRAADLIEKNKLRRMKPHKRGIFLSAMRSWIFNMIVSDRINDQTFQQAVTGDVFMLAESSACFTEALSELLENRLKQKEIHLTAAMWGRGDSMAAAMVAEAEQGVADQFPVFSDALEKAGLKQERRAMRLMPVNLNWEFDTDNSVTVSFELTKGSYATAVLRELCEITDVSLPGFK